ncbi:MAG: sigma-70 family RNA polymerase sigma factor [Polyangiaceae bacterium]|nr:sigma-70 family RNA polymerase sigma factor [Polyangiaceae bacterium]MBK8942094.1 sigma-70 family RNA polymerase sigma factor [Polyangiaceae bacterium]
MALRLSPQPVRASDERRVVTAVAPPPPPAPADAARLSPLVRAVIARVMQLPLSHPDVDDCANESLRRIVENLDRVRPGEPVGPWATGVARHVALDWLRAKKRARARAPETSEPGGAAPDLPDPGPSPEDRAADAQALGELRKALAQLPEAQREALVAFHVEGQSYHDIAARMRVPMGTIATWIARGRRALADAVGGARKEGR